MSLPALHTFGIIVGLYVPIAALVTAVVYPPRTENHPLAQPVIPTGENIADVLRKVQCNSLLKVPSFLEQITMSGEAIEVLKKVDSVLFGGGPLPVKVGNTLCAAGVQFRSGYGATEFGAPVMTTAKTDIADGDWMWMRIVDDLKVRWAPQGDDTYELQILKTDDHYIAVENMPNVKGYATSDVFVKHPIKDAWVLIEPRAGHAIDVSNANMAAEFRNQIWPVIEEANKPLPAFSRIFEEMILITSKGKPMSCASKGTVQQKATPSAYAAEINAFYDIVEASVSTPGSSIGPSAWTSEAVGDWLLDHARSINSNDVSPHVDLFAQGFDSVTYLRNRILDTLRKSQASDIKKAAPYLPPNVVFENPTIQQQLSARIVALVHDGNSGKVADLVEQHKHIINTMIEKYSVGLGGPVDGVLSSSTPIQPVVVLLTGTTGGLGSFLLSKLFLSPSVQRVSAFNRPLSIKSIEERQRSAFSDRGLALSLLGSNRLTYVEANASLDRCELRRSSMRY